MIYFDHNATTPVHPKVRETIAEAMEEFWGNPSSGHSVGRKAFAQLEKARERFAALIGATPKEVYFTSGGTESDNLAILGTLERNPGAGFIISAIEHPAVYEAALSVVDKGHPLQIVPVESDGVVRLDALAKTLNENVKLVSIIYANNEIGTIQPITEIGDLLKSKNILFHTDAVQAFGKAPITVGKCHVSMMSVSSHKIFGPKGCGALYVKQGVILTPRTLGGSQERNMRTGTENLPGILGFVKAAEIVHANLEQDAKRLFNLTELLYKEISDRVENVIRNGHAEKRIPGTLNLCIPGAETGSLLASLDQEGICASGGAACSSGSIHASRTLLSIGRRKTDAVCAIRFSLGSENTIEEVLSVAVVLEKVVARIRSVNK
jgi:cysteine desulfurase